MGTRKPFSELEFCDAFMFAAAMEDEEICREVLERILEIPIKKVKVHVEHTVLYNSDYRGLRIDVWANDENGTIFNVEMQTTNKGDLPKRSRFHQIRMDATALKPGAKFSDLPQNYVIFICTFDPFGKKRCRYTFKNKCLEDDIYLEDGTSKIFLNTKGKADQSIPKELVAFLNYVDHADLSAATQDDILLSKLNDRIKEIKKSRRWEERYMLFGEMLDDAHAAGRAEGEAAGLAAGMVKGQEEAQTQLFRLISAMTADGHLGDVPKLQERPEFMQEMLKQYNLI